jgi:hypothetical protein
MKYEKKFRQEEQQQVSENQSQSQQTIHDFATPEEMLRFDAKNTAVPDAIAERLSRSVKNQPHLTQPQQPWWKRLFS